jgi:prevent-host-death family protein
VKTVGVRQLKNEATQIVRAVREEGAQFVVTVGGQPVAVIRPFTADDAEAADRARSEQFLAALAALSGDVGRAWQSPLSASQAVEEQRRRT